MAARPLDRLYAIVYFDAWRVKIRDEGTVRSKAVYLALGVRTDGSRDILGLWIEQTEGAKFWLKVFTDLRARGCEDILIAVTDGLAGTPEALERRSAASIAVSMNCSSRTACSPRRSRSLEGGAEAGWRSRRARR